MDVRYLSGALRLLASSNSTQCWTLTLEMAKTMPQLSLLVVLAHFLVGLAAAHAPWPVRRAPVSLDDWLVTESQYALDGILNNIGAEGGKVQGASSGVVVASPSKSDPDC